jgi:hypothetical protein
MTEFKQYKRSAIAEMANWEEGIDVDMSLVSVSQVDKSNGSPKEGDMIARNPKNHADMWLVAKDYFEQNFEQIEATDVESQLHQLEVIKNNTIKNLLDNPELTKFKKLSIISRESLWEYEDFIQPVFGDWENECKAKEEELAIKDGKIKGKDYICYFTDIPLFEHYDRHEIIDYATVLDYLKCDYNEDELIEVVTCRGQYGVTIEKTLTEIIDKVYDHAVETQSIGFKMDW